MPKLPETDNFIVDLRNPPLSPGPSPRNTAGQRGAIAKRFSLAPSSCEERSGRRVGVEGGWFHFVQYNNAFLIIIVACVLAFGSLSFASEEVRDATIGGKTIYAEGTDNTLLLERDFDKFNMDFKITGIMEDEESYVVNYSYVDFDLSSSDIGSPTPRGESDSQTGSVWQFIERQGARKIDKPFRQDLGMYLANQLGQEAKARIKELKRLQREEREKGLTKIVQVTEYSGLIGKVLDLSTAIFPGYEPVKKVELETPAVNEQIAQRASSGTADNLANVYNNWVEEHPGAIADLNAGETAATTTAETAGTSDERQGTNNGEPAANNEAAPKDSAPEPAASEPSAESEAPVVQ